MTLSINANLWDIYQKEDGSLYRVIGIQHNPAVILERFSDYQGVPDTDHELIRREYIAVTSPLGRTFKKIGSFETPPKLTEE